MILLVNKIISSIVQIVLFALIPFIWWLVISRKHRSFLKWIGIERIDTKNRKILWFWIICISFAFILLGSLILYILQYVETATSEFTGLGVQAVPSIIIYAALNTALPEEILFRGFLLKRLQNKIGFIGANVIQALLFGLLHGAMFLTLVGIIKSMLIILFTGIIAWFMGYINEKKANGSIIPSLIIHTVSNLFSGICSAFLII